MSCQCVPCSECGGTGVVFRSFTGNYLGNHRCDDLDEMETCDECGGDGLSEMCEECQLKAEEAEEERMSRE